MIPEPVNGDPLPTVDAEGKTAAEKSDKPPAELSPEEQMALYEKELKESDWGHQPC